MPPLENQPNWLNEATEAVGFLKWYQEAAAWSLATFGGTPDAKPLGTLRHLQEELDEAIEALDGPRHKLWEEIADIVGLACGAAWRSGMTFNDLVHQLERKLEINRVRKWRTVENGYRKHVKEPADVEQTGTIDPATIEVETFESKLAKAAYAGYCESSGGKSLVSGASLPEWPGLKDDIRKAWASAALRVGAIVSKAFRTAKLAELEQEVPTPTGALHELEAKIEAKVTIDDAALEEKLRDAMKTAVPPVTRESIERTLANAKGGKIITLAEGISLEMSDAPAVEMWRKAYGVFVHVCHKHNYENAFERWEALPAPLLEAFIMAFNVVVSEAYRSFRHDTVRRPRALILNTGKEPVTLEWLGNLGGHIDRTEKTAEFTNIPGPCDFAGYVVNPSSGLIWKPKPGEPGTMTAVGEFNNRQEFVFVCAKLGLELHEFLLEEFDR